VSNRVKQRRLEAQMAAGMPTKRERRELGRKAAAARAASLRRRRLLRDGGTVLGVLGVIGIIWLAYALLGGSGQPAPEATTPANQDLTVKPVVDAGTGDLTKLKVTTIVQGNGPVVTKGQTITVQYVGVNYKTGKEFDSSWDRGQPTPFEIGTGNVIKGWDEGLVGVKVGSRVQLDIPSDLAYGDTGNGDPATAGPLRFVVDIISAADPTPSASPGASASPSPSPTPTPAA
jgi:FKBP-type peptidyl-prolyl isomerase-like protein